MGFHICKYLLDSDHSQAVAEITVERNQDFIRRAVTESGKCKVLVGDLAMKRLQHEHASQAITLRSAFFKIKTVLMDIKFYKV